MRHCKANTPAKTPTVSRIGDMHPTRSLLIHEQDDGDVIVAIAQDGLTISAEKYDTDARVEFCVSGGRSHRTREALRNLARAIELDNAEYPIP